MMGDGTMYDREGGRQEVIQDVGEQEDSAALIKARALKENGGKVSADGILPLNGGDDDEVDISDPNQGKKIRIGKKLRKQPKDGKTRSFDDLVKIKDDKRKEGEKAARIRAKKAKLGIKVKSKAGKKRK